MKKSIVILFLICILNIVLTNGVEIAHDQSLSLPPGYTGPVHVHFTNQNMPTYPVSINNAANAQAQSHALAKTNATQYMIDLIAHSRIAGSSWLQGMREYVRNHKINTFFATFGALYIMLFSMVIYYQLKNTYGSYWASWKEPLPFEALIALPVQELRQELLIAIQTRYQTAQHPIDFLTPLSAFLIDINSEITALSHFIALRQWISLFRITILFPLQDNAITQAYERLKRASYIREIFLRWTAEYKIQINMPAQHT